MRPTRSFMTLMTLTILVASTGRALAQAPAPRAHQRVRGGPPVFSASVSFELSSSEPADIEVADFDSDGALDLAVSGSGGHQVAVLFGDGAGGFADKEDFTAIGFSDPGPWGLASGDFDGDGNRDLAVISGDRGLDVFPGLGDGTFGPPIPMQGSYDPRQGRRLAAADLDHDGHVDLVASFGGGHGVIWGDGTGTFDFTQSTGVGPGAHFAVDDVNGDGHLDVVAPVRDKFPNYTGGLWVVLGDGARGFLLEGRYGASFVAPDFVATGDLNGDGIRNLVALEQGLRLRPFTGAGDGSFLEHPPLEAGKDPTCLALGDWNGDGLGDIAAPYRNLGQTPYVAIRLNITP